MRRQQATLLCLTLAAHVVAAAAALPSTAKATAAAATRQAAAAADECADLSTATPDWQLTNAASSDWPGGGSGRVQLFARHVPTGQLASCNVPYQLTEEGEIVEYDPAATHECVNFGASSLDTTVQLDSK